MPYSTIEKLAREMKKEPDLKFMRLADIGRKARERGHFTKPEFLDICGWKSKRRIALYSSNSEMTIKDSTAFAFATKDEQSRIETLTKLAGVAVPTASALLTVSCPTSFGVIDIRAWQFLHSEGIVTRNKNGVNLSVNNWLEYLDILRNIASRAKTTPRLVEISLYKAHKAKQKGPLYRSSRMSSNTSAKGGDMKRCFRTNPHTPNDT